MLSQAGMLLDGIACLGKCGTMVPAVTTSPSLNFVRAKSLASVSVSNVLVDRGLRDRTKVPLLGISKVTYQVYRIPHPKMAQHGDISALVKRAPMMVALDARYSGRSTEGEPLICIKGACLEPLIDACPGPHRSRRACPATAYTSCDPECWTFDDLESPALYAGYFDACFGGL